MSDQSIPNGRCLRRMNRVRLHLAEAVALVCNPDSDEDQDAFDLRFYMKFARCIERVRGNRPAGYAVTWDDLRMVMASELRICLRHLENPNRGE